MKRSHIIDTPTPHEFIAVFIDDQGLHRNVTLTHPELNAQLVATPTHIPNPARPAVEEAIFAAAEAQLDAENAPAPARPPKKPRK